MPDDKKNDQGSQKTLFPEFEAIELAIKIIDLLEMLHSLDIVHTNLAPEQIFLRNSDPSQMCFLNLYHCSWKPKVLLKGTPYATGIDGLDDNLSIFDLRTRNRNYVSPEQLAIFEQLTDLTVVDGSSKIDEESYEIQEFLLMKKHLKSNGISKLCDIYSIGALIFKLLMGRAPTLHLAKYINQNNLHELEGSKNVYETPFFMKDFIVSDDMCQILVKLLHENPACRFQSIKELRFSLVQLRENILQTPLILRKIVGHPTMPNEEFTQNIDSEIGFQNARLNEFSLKYLAKFVFEHKVENLAINGAFMQLHKIKTNNM